ncbi:MAG: DUF6597 domain-containing transcriptional factor [Streptosporangiaceae bacterium]
MADSASVAMGRGVLRPGLAADRFGLARMAPSGPLAPFVDYYWIVRWDLRGQPPYEQTILPHPNVNLVFEASGAGIYGVDRALFTRRLSGLGKALGVRFRAGCFRPFWGAPISQLSDRVVPGVRVFGPLAEKTRVAIMAAESDGEMAGAAESLLFSCLPERDPVASRLADLVALITSDSSLRRVDQLAAVSGVSMRNLQRMFADYVGVSPKWVMRRARLHEAALRADGGEPVDWAALALDLGYADQAHLTREFTATIGVPPSHYAAAPLRCLGLHVVWPTAGFEGVADRGDDGGGLGTDLAGRERQHEDAALAHSALPLERPIVIVRRHMPLVRVDLDGDAFLGPPSVRCGNEGAVVVVVYRGVEQRHRQAGFREQVLEVSFCRRADPVGDVGQRLAEQRRPSAGARVELGDEVRHAAVAALHGVGHHRPHVAQAGQVAHGIGDGPRGQGVVQRAELPDPLRQAGGPVKPGEGRVPAFARRRYQDVDELGGWPLDVMLPDGREPGDHAAAPRVQQGGHLLLEKRRRPGRRQVDPGEQAPPGPVETETMPQGVSSQADGYRLPAGDHVELLIECPGERVPVNSCRRSHADIMAGRSDKPGASVWPLGLELNRPNVPLGRL